MKKIWLKFKHSIRRIEFRKHRITCIILPYKGSWAWETQIGPLVLQWWFVPDYHKFSRSHAIKRFNYWFDSAWRL